MKLETEPITKEQVLSLRKAINSRGSEIIIDWEKIDYEVGRGILDDKNHCLWTTDGYRIEVNVLDTGGLIISQSEEVDPNYKKLKGE